MGIFFYVSKTKSLICTVHCFPNTQKTLWANVCKLRLLHTLQFRMHLNFHLVIKRFTWLRAFSIST